MKNPTQPRTSPYEAAILELLQDGEPHSSEEIADVTGIRKPAHMMARLTLSLSARRDSRRIRRADCGKGMAWYRLILK